ncbi:nucleotidyl transferase AbiEii/AbiGii toxin family protein [Frigoriglobus tundricola]|uniref:Nucleotidyl transferase AbiEii/AbiGii toxin family protein n=1 Tax=Frigoriglobus tundricola TaxID=2774151 RepID=A0A6M5YZD6_9BACT|nr:nucleotidyl transferase AbiEii/AbiGii toxin family protein [Frigoriglobus tundricola]QJW99228.1 hypothetical protein FTUN_6830 [Frigoriglobus tundricola]
MRTTAISPTDLRHRLLEGVLLRLARHPSAGDFVVRGGVLLRQWFRPAPRPADDLDLVATFPFSAAEAGRRFLPVLADSAVEDGVRFDHEAVRVEGIFLETGSPGVRVFISGTFAGHEDDFHVDVTSGPQPRPAPVCGAVATASGADARLWVCRPECIVAQKVQALRHLGQLCWRQKDLNDLRLLLARVPVDGAELRTALAAYLADLGGSLDDIPTLFGPESWWGMKLSAARWLDFTRASAGRDVPKDLTGVVAEIRDRLASLLEGTE